MRSPLHPLSNAHGPPSASSDRSICEGLFGAGHPLVGLLRRSETAFEQLVWVTAAQAAGLVFLSGRLEFGLSLAIAAAVVQVGLGCRLAGLRARRRDVCLDLIVSGSPRLPLACVDREWRRLLDPRRAQTLARSVNEILKAAARPRSGPWPLFDVGVVRQVAPELNEIASLLRGEGSSVRGVAAVELLLTSPATPLYGREVQPLRQELGRARYLLRLAP